MHKRIKYFVAIAVLLSAAALSACETPGDRIPAGPYGGCPRGYHPGPEHHWCYPNR